MPVYPGVTQVVYGDVPVTAGCATVTCLLRPGATLHYKTRHMGQYQLLSVLSDRLSPLNIDHSRNLPVEICGINYTEKYANL